MHTNPKSPDGAVDTYLAERFRVGLEQVLLEATGGYVRPELGGVVEASCERVNHWKYADHGQAEQYTGHLIVDGVRYQFRCWVYCEDGGQRFLSDLSEFVPDGWRAAIRVSEAAAR